MALLDPLLSESKENSPLNILDDDSVDTCIYISHEELCDVNLHSSSLSVLQLNT